MPGEYTHYRDNGRGFDMGHNIRVTPPLPPMTILGTPILAAPSAPVSPSEFWDNITIPLSAYIPAPRDSSPEHRTPPPASAYQQHRGALPVWDQPVQTYERPFKSVPDEEPITSGSTLPEPNDSSYWLHCHRAVSTTAKASNTPKARGTNRQTAQIRATTSTRVTHAP